MLKSDIPEAMQAAPASGARNVAAAKVLLWVLLAASTGWLAYGWVLALTPQETTQRVPQRAAIDVAAAVEKAAGANLFGKPAVKTAVPEVVALDIKLKGVFAGGGPVTGAIVNTGGKDQFVEVGKEIRPGVVLRDVHAGYIVVNRDGTAQRVDLGRLQSSGGSPFSARGGGARDERPPDNPPAQPQPMPAPVPPTNAPLPENAPVPENAPSPEHGPMTAPPAAVSQAPGFATPNTVGS